MVKRWSFRTLLLVFLLSATLVTAQQSTTTATPSIAIIMDASGSMQALIGSGRSRFAVAKEAIITLSAELPADTTGTLWVYGHRLSQADPAASCQDIEQVIPLSQIDPQTYADAVTPLTAIGYTPIATTLQMAADSLPPDGPKLIVLMSDGEESCGGDPCEVAARLTAGGFDLIVNTIGFAADAETRAQLQCIADVTNGTYYEAQNAGALIESLREASAPVATVIIPTVTLVPTNTPAPTVTPLPTNTPAPTTTPLPTNTPAPTQTFTPLPTNTPAPTETPAPTNTPLPTNTPVPTSTLVPTQTFTPLPTDTPPPTNTPAPVGEQETELPFGVSRIEIEDNRAQYPKAVLDRDQNLHLIWYDTTTRADGTGDLKYRMRTPQGLWLPEVNLTENFTTWLNATYAIARTMDGTACIFIEGIPVGTQYNEVYRRCVVDGVIEEPVLVELFAQIKGRYFPVYDASNTLQAIVNRGNNLINAATGETLGSAPYGATEQFVIDSAGGYHLVWLGIGGINFTIQYRYSPDGGITWEPEESLTLNFEERQETQPQLVADAFGNVHLLYVAGEVGSDAIEYRKWTPDGGWREAVAVAESPSVGLPSLAVDDDGLAYATWHDVGAINYSIQQPDGSWTEPRQAVEEMFAGSDDALLVDTSGTIHYVWDDGTEERIRYTQLER